MMGGRSPHGGILALGVERVLFHNNYQIVAATRDEFDANAHT
jgi:hypothetical protein